MSEFGQQLKERRRAARQEALHHIDVPEWGEKVQETIDDDGEQKTVDRVVPKRIFFRPYTLEEERRIRKFSKNDVWATNVYAVIFKALDENGKKIFDIEDVDWMLDTERSDVITRINVAMNNATDEPDPAKNS